MSDKYLDQNVDTEGTNDGMLQNGVIESTTSENGKHSAYQSFKRRLANDKIFKKKFIIFLCLCYSFLILGLNIGQLGPTLLDLQRITGCSLDQAAFFFNANTLGYLTSSILTGIVFERFNKLLQMFLPCFLLTGVNAAIPWCTLYEVMVTVHFLKGFFLGFIDAVANAVLLHLLAQEVKTYMQTLHFVFALGGIISPIISAPFLYKLVTTNQTVPPLIQLNNNSMMNNTGYSYVNTTNSIGIHQFGELANMSTVFSNEPMFNPVDDGESQVYKPYMVTAFMCFSSSIPFLVLYLQRNESKCPTSETQTDEHPKEDISIRLKISVLVILSLIIAAYTAMEDTYAGFLMTFTVKHLNWTKPQGSFATSVFWTSFAVGRFSGIFIVNFFRQARLLRVYSLMIITSFICLVATSFYHIGEGVWIASVITGFAMSIFFPIFFSWTEERFFHVDGKITALIMTTAMIGVIINPIILSRVMDTKPIWFGYLLLIESILLFLFFTIGVYIAKLIKKSRIENRAENDGVEEALSPTVQNSEL